jgi:radical SAM superfamily enzyme YgiQ (UPF0313 family)
MKVTLIQIDLVMGSRVLLSVLNEKEYEVKALQINIRYTDTLTEDDLDVIYEYVADSDVVGISFNTFYVFQAQQLANYLKKKGVKHIIVGGNHATALPDEVMAYSDIAVRYEAEITLPLVLNAIKAGSGLLEIKGISYKHDGNVFHNSDAPEIVWELDCLPFQSVDTELIKYFSLEKKLYTPRKDELFPYSGNTYFMLTSRGCPFGCSYCSNSLYHKIDKRFGTVRKRSVSNIIAEMEYALSDGFKSFHIVDDHFFSFTSEELKHFNSEYKKRIKKSFFIVGLNPNNFRSPSAERKLNLLLDCGLCGIRIGIQSGSDKTLRIFKRRYKSEEIPKLLSAVERNRKTIWNSPHDKLHVALDFICDAVWETEEDKIATIRLAQRILTQYSIYFYTLVYLPGTELYDLALKNGWIDDRIKDIYLRGIAGVDDNMYNRVLFLIAITKERGVTLSKGLIDGILELSGRDPDLAKEIINSIIDSSNRVEQFHEANHPKHAGMHPRLKGFNEWTKTKGRRGRKVLFRSYHEPYG